MKKFTITQRNGTEHIVSVDDDDWDLVSKHTWSVQIKDGKVVAVKTDVRRNGKRTTLQLHQLLMGPVPPEYANIDHIDRNPLNNCRANLRFATVREQNINKGMQRNNISGVTGVCRHKATNKWQVQIDGKYVGYYTTFEKACEVRVQVENERKLLMGDKLCLR
jgi:hypothetical protein